MRPNKNAATFGLAALVLTVALAALLVVSGCGSKEVVKTPVKKPAVVATETVEVTEAVEATVVAPVVPVAPAAPAAPIVPTGPWPAKVASSFAMKVKIPAWWPKTLPKGVKMDSLDVLELEPGTGLVCDAFFIGGATEIGFLQGSPKTREVEIVSLGKVPWGTETADIVSEDPEDPAAAKMIVYNAKGTLAELTGGTSIEQLKGVAAGMVLVK
ncbi:MAG: hypothetical protein Q7W16_02190 [Coriobacteriia bacterium]|nr:hypothetical protein [Coriobacteriia bacterium]